MTIQLAIDTTISIAVPSGILSLFDPLLIEHRADQHRGWWQQAPELIQEVQSGDIAIIKLKSAKNYTLRLTSNALDHSELSRAISVIKLMGISVKSGHIIIGDSKLLPGHGKTVAQQALKPVGERFDIPNGRYNIAVYALARSEHGDSHDIVIIIKNRLEVFPGIEGITELFIDSQAQKATHARLEGFDEFSEYERRQMERNGQESIAGHAGKLRNPADYLPQEGAEMGQLFKAHAKFQNQPTGEFKQPNQMSLNEVLDKAEKAPELAASPKLEQALAARAAAHATPSPTRGG